MRVMSLSNPNRASNALSRGDCRDLESAVAAVCEEVWADREWDAAYADDAGPSSDDATLLDTLEQDALAAQMLFRHCRETGRDAVTELRRVGLDDWADALDTGDFSRFAI